MKENNDDKYEDFDEENLEENEEVDDNNENEENPENNYEEEPEMNQKEMIDKLLEEAENANFTEFDDKQLKKSIVDLENLISKNQELRGKFSKQPENFMDSEVELHEEIKKIQQITAYPELLKILIDLHGVPTLLSLLGHENTDIIADIVEVIFKFILNIILSYLASQ